MDLKQIKELMAAMEKTGIKELSIKDREFELRLVGKNGHSFGPGNPEDYERNQLEKDEKFLLNRADQAFIKGSGTTIVPHSSNRGSDEIKNESDTDRENVRYIKSPMVGTFYSAPSSDDLPFIKPGDEVKENTVVCIIEAMKVMNEIKAGVTGIVKEVLVENSDPVEFGSPLFTIQ